MKCRIKQEKGITMVALVITVLILLILTNMLIYNAQDNIYIKNLTNLYNDISMLREKVSAYYNKYGKIPAEIKYTNEDQLQNLSSVLSTQNDTGDFYVIDLEAMQGITLNYGKEYEKVKNDKENANSYTDLYIINENSHNIFYVEGVKIKENDTTKIYYTDYIEPDQTAIDLRYIDGILIPDGYYYIGKTTDNSGNESIVISNVQGEDVDTSKTNQYVWTKQISEVEKKPDSVTLEENQKEYQFVKSVNTYKGYFKNSEGKVQYVVVDEDAWSEKYTKEMNYEDKNGDIVTIPKGFRVSMSPTMNTVENGLVVKDGNDNEWVWVVVPSNVFITAENNTDYDNIKADLVEYAKDYRGENITQQDIEYNDEWYDGCGVKDSTTYIEMYNKMLSSVYTNKGFWISRYEIGISNVRNAGGEIEEEAKSQANLYPYNYVTVSQSETLAEGMSKVTNKTSTLLFGIQWDLVCKFLEENSTLTKDDINADSTSWGNYTGVKITNIKPGAVQYMSLTKEWSKITSDKLENEPILLSTGASDQTQKLNIYDFAGNEWEWTLEKITNAYFPYTARGGYYYPYGGLNYPASYRGYNATYYNDRGISFRVALY